MPKSAGQRDGGTECDRDIAGGRPDPALLPGLVPPSRHSPGARSHRSMPRLARLEEAVRISTAGLEPADAVRPASDFAAVLGESEASYGG
ncbi:hypothetical protein AB0N16_13640 [Streptomyces sp. NPDC051105]|uniref:hypothetical protein n=1 Tax=Streptomyces sp. NPDC051105 TaxID=3154843 RepID=UPI003413208A